MTVNPKALSNRRKKLRLTLDKLADDSNVNRQTIHRIESGARSTVRANTAEKLAKALRCSVEELQREPTVAPDVPASDSSDLGNSGLSQVSHRVDPAIKNALWLVARHYRISEADIIRLAPLLFTLVAEDSLAHREDTVKEFKTHLMRAEELAPSLRHMPPAFIYPSNRCGEGVDAEIESVETHDIFGDHVNDTLGDYDLSSDYSSDTDNPFAAFLQRYAHRFPDEHALVCSVARGSAGYRVLQKDTQEIACGDDDVSSALTHGWVSLNDLPRDLLDPAKAADRLAWLKTRVEQVKASWPAELTSLI
jgi:transcriptional regulator with XRE-family HTH domain